MGICSTPSKQEQMKTTKQFNFKNITKKKNGKYPINNSFIPK